MAEFLIGMHVLTINAATSLTLTGSDFSLMGVNMGGQEGALAPPRGSFSSTKSSGPILVIFERT